MVANECYVRPMTWHTLINLALLASLTQNEHFWGFFRKTPKDAAKYLNDYLEKENRESQSPLLTGRGGNRLTRNDVYTICQRISLFAPTKTKLTPHMLRHTFLKRVTDKHGVHVAQKLSGNTSVREIFRYARPSEEEVEEVVEGLF